MGTAIKHPVPDQVKPSFIIFNIRACQKITNDGLTQSGIGCLIAVHIWQQWASRGKGRKIKKKLKHKCQRAVSLVGVQFQKSS